MCQNLSPERAVIWSVLHDVAHFRAVEAVLESAFFTHPPYRRWYELTTRLYGAGVALSADTFVRALEAEGVAPPTAEQRALRRMFRDRPPARVSANLGLFARALADRHAGRPVHLERVIN